MKSQLSQCCWSAAVAIGGQYVSQSSVTHGSTHFQLHFANLYLHDETTQPEYLHGWHTHTHEPTHTHVSRHTYTHSFHYSFPLAVHPVNCYALHGFTYKLCLVELFFYVFRLQCFHWPTIQPSFSTICILTDVFFTCVTGLCVLYIVV